MITVDMFGESISIGDMVLYGNGSDICYGTFAGIAATGMLTIHILALVDRRYNTQVCKLSPEKFMLLKLLE